MIRIWPIISGACPYLLFLPDLKTTAQFIVSFIYLLWSRHHHTIYSTLAVGVLLISCLLRNTWSAYSNFVARNAFFKSINLRLTSTLTFSIDSKEFSRNRFFSGPWRCVGRKFLWLSNERVEDVTMIIDGTSCDQSNLYIKHQTPCWHWVPRCRRHVVRHQTFKEKENERKSRDFWETTPLLWGVLRGVRHSHRQVTGEPQTFWIF